MFLCVIAHNEQCVAPVLKALDLHIDDSVNDDFEEDYWESVVPVCTLSCVHNVEWEKQEI